MWNLLTRRCYLRDYGEEDREAFVRINTDSVAREYLGGALTIGEAHAMFESTLTETDPGKGVRLAVFDRKSNVYMGHVFFVPWEDSKDEIEWGILLRPEYWGQGLGTEVARSAIEECFRQRGIRRMYATIDGGHRASSRLLEKLGFVAVGRYQDEQGYYEVFALDAVNSATLTSKAS